MTEPSSRNISSTYNSYSRNLDSLPLDKASASTLLGLSLQPQSWLELLKILLLSQWDLHLTVTASWPTLIVSQVGKIPQLLLIFLISLACSNSQAVNDLNFWNTVPSSTHKNSPAPSSSSMLFFPIRTYTYLAPKPHPFAGWLACLIPRSR